jgi:hypothetical protein
MNQATDENLEFLGGTCRCLTCAGSSCKQHKVVILLSVELLLPCIYLKKSGLDPNSQIMKMMPSNRIAFGSCNEQNLENSLWPIIEERAPAAFIWGGDAIYGGEFRREIMVDLLV